MLPKVIFLGPKKTETKSMIFFDTKNRYIDITTLVLSRQETLIFLNRGFGSYELFYALFYDRAILLLFGNM